MIVFKLIIQHQTIVSVTETSSKMASTLNRPYLKRYRLRPIMNSECLVFKKFQ